MGWCIRLFGWCQSVASLESVGNDGWMGRCRLVLRTYTKIESGTAAFCRKLRTARRVRILASTSGFTLIEAILSSLLVAISFLGVLMMFSNAQTSVQSSGTDRIAAQLAQQRIEQVRATGYGTKFPADPREELIWTLVPNNPGYERITVITDVCSTNFNIVWDDGACLPATTEAQTRIVVVTVRALNNNQPLVDPQTTPAVLQTVLVRR
jgi:type II secretory pathway pseudopilin PulG